MTNPEVELFSDISREYLPLVLGRDALGDLAKTTTLYSPSQQPSIFNELAAVAFRYCNLDDLNF